MHVIPFRPEIRAYRVRDSLDTGKLLFALPDKGYILHSNLDASVDVYPGAVFKTYGLRLGIVIDFDVVDKSLNMKCMINWEVEVMRLAIKHANLLADYTRHRITNKTLDKLLFSWIRKS